MKNIKIGDVAILVSKGTTPTSVGLSFSNCGIPFLRGEDILGTEVDFSQVKMFISEESHKKLSRSELIFGDILITIAGTIGRIGFVNKKESRANCNQAVAFIRVDLTKVDPLWLCFVLQSKDYQNQFARFVAGGAIPNVNLQQINSIEIPDIKISIQRQIATKLKTQVSEFEKAQKAIEEQWREIQNLANAVISDSIQRGNTIRHKLADVLNEIKKGIGETWKDYPVMGATRNGMALAKEPPGQFPQRYKPVVPGTVFYNPMRILIGSIAFMDEGDEPGITSPDYVVLQGKEGILDSRWFYYWLRSPLGEQCINSLARGAVRERMLFNRLAEGEIELPDFSIQKRASESLKELVNIKKTIKKQLDEIKLIPNKLLAQAFNID